MKRVFATLITATLLALIAGACDDEPRHRDYGYGYGNPHCGQYATCGACTPALGCGWCMTGGSAGLCVDDPGNCPAATTVGWTWDPVGCHAGTSDASVLADASVGHDAGSDAAPEASDAAPP